MLVAYSYLIVEAGKLPLPWENPRQRRIHRRNQHLYWIKVIFTGLKLFQGPLQSLIFRPIQSQYLKLSEDSLWDRKVLSVQRQGLY